MVLTQSRLAKQIIDVLHLKDDTMDHVDNPYNKYLANNEECELSHNDIEYQSMFGLLYYL